HRTAGPRHGKPFHARRRRWLPDQAGKCGTVLGNAETDAPPSPVVHTVIARNVRIVGPWRCIAATLLAADLAGESSHEAVLNGSFVQGSRGSTWNQLRRSS